VVLDNGQELVSLPRNTFKRLIITAGSHEIGFPYRKEPTLTIEAVKGETYYLKVAHEARTSWAYSIEGDPIELEQLTEGEAKILLEKLKPFATPVKPEMKPDPSVRKKISTTEAKPEIKISQTPPQPTIAETIPPNTAEKKLSAKPAKSVIVTNEPPPATAKMEMTSDLAGKEMITGNYATLFIFNLSGWTLLSGNQTVLDNGSELVSLPRNTYSKETISPGRHELGFKNREEPKLILDVVKGQTYYVSFAYQQQSSWVSTTKTDPIETKQLSEEDARQLMKKITYFH
jgi:hypothetical protein